MDVESGAGLAGEGVEVSHGEGRGFGAGAGDGAELEPGIPRGGRHGGVEEQGRGHDEVGREGGQSRDWQLTTVHIQ